MCDVPDDRCTGFSAVHWLFGSGMVGLLLLLFVPMLYLFLAMLGLCCLLCMNCLVVAIVGVSCFCECRGSWSMSFVEMPGLCSSM